MAKQPRIDDLVAQLRDTLDLRAKSLIVTVYGDAIAPHGGSVWLGSLIRLVAPLGLNERMVRTAVFRLAKDDWLTAQQIGRRSYYGFSEAGRRRFDEAHRRIYAEPQRPWNGVWHLLVSGFTDLSAERRDALRRELAWRGFGQLSPGVFAHPSADPDALRDLVQDQGLADDVVIMRAGAELPGDGASLRRLAARCWDLQALARDYEGFLKHFRPLWRALENDDKPRPDACFLIRTLLIHDYRRVLLRDPVLPQELLPAGWPGSAARMLCRNLYHRTQAAAEQHIMAVLETADGPLPVAASSFRQRFGGLDLDIAL